MTKHYIQWIVQWYFSGWNRWECRNSLNFW